MLPSWERILYFHFLPAVLDGLVALAGVLLLLRIFRVRDPRVRALFLFIPLVRPLIILLEGGAWIESVSFPNVVAGVRIPDPLHLIPFEIADKQGLSTLSQLIAFMLITAVVAALAFLSFRWAGFLVFYRRLRRHSVRLGEKIDAGLIRQIEDLSHQMGLRQPPEILLFRGNWTTPCAIGWRRPALVIDPDLMLQFDAEELRAILAHELGHILRRDCLWHWASVLLRDVQSFNPFTHMSLARLSLEREKACDQSAIDTAGVHPHMLAECLVKTTRLMVEKNAEPLPGYGMGFIGRQGLLERRLIFLLSMPEPHKGQQTPRMRTTLGKTRLALLFMAWLPLTLLQFYACVWAGAFPLVIK